MRNFKKIVGVFVFVIACVILPNCVSAKTIEEIKATKELDLNMVPITNEFSYYMATEVVDAMYPRYGIDNCNEDYTICNFVLDYNEVIVENVKINYIYDPVVKTVVDNIMKKIPSDGVKLNLTDIEFINYLLNTNNTEDEDAINISTYSSELKELIGYNNFAVEIRQGDESEVFEYQGGTADFTYNGTIYGFAENIEVLARNVVYVPSDTDDIVNAVKERLSKFFSIKDVVKTNYTIAQYLTEQEEEYGRYYDEYIKVGASREDYIANQMNSNFKNEDAIGKFLYDAEEEFYEIEFTNGKKIQMAIVKDSSKIKNDAIKTVSNDANTGITISTTSKEVPLDTLIKVARLTSGAEYEKISNILNVTNSEMFDLKLFSKTSGDYITRLNDGTFEVKIPISEKLRDKDLVVYYVKDDNTIEEYEVDNDNNYAVFSTNHFSIYTLAEKTTNGTAATGTPSTTPTNSNPQTGDNVMIYISMLGLSIIGLVEAGFYFKKRLFNK